MQLIRKLRSPYHKVVLEAIEELRARRWLSDGSLVEANLAYVHLDGTDLTGANLKGANLHMATLEGTNLSMACLDDTNLYQANLRYADFSHTSLAGADLYKADLTGARNLGEDQLARARRLCDAILPNGLAYDGHLHLAGDLQFTGAGAPQGEDY
jgi:uncharacterized protein YjbI with pentapeptide repeats